MSPVFMTLLLIGGWGIFAYSAVRRWSLMNVGAPAQRYDRPGERIRGTLRYAFAQLRMRRYPLAGFAHMLIFAGFFVLLLRSLILWGRGYETSFDFWIFGVDQPLGKLYSLLKDVFVVLVLAGTLVFIYYRVVRRLPRMTLSFEGLLILLIIVAMMLADVLYDGASMVRMAGSDAATAAANGGTLSFHAWEPVGSVVQYAIAGLPEGGIVFLQHAGFWTHSALVLIFLNLLPYSKHFHVITAIPNVYTRNLKPSGRLAPIDDLEGMVEREETLGIKKIDQFSWKSILDFYTCTECGRCTDFCPASNTGKKLSPKHFTMDLRDFLYKHEGALVSANGSRTGADGEPAAHEVDLVGNVIHPEVLWACTTCRACEVECPVLITYVDKMVDLRRYLVQESGVFPEQLQSAFRGLEASANPWGFPAEDRAAWASDLNIPLLSEKPDVPVLFWVGCAPSYDDRAKSTARATARLLQQADVDFAILGPEEQCTGDPARRAGNEYLFQFLANANVEVLNQYGADQKTIVTTCPHCFNTLKNEYGDFGGHYSVVHHSEFLSRLVREGKLKPRRSVSEKVTFHDSCYLGRYNDVYEGPRDALKSIPGLTVLEPAETRDRGMCCGAGGAQMFKEEEPGSERVNLVRTDQLLNTGAEVVASACPFCMRMLTDGINTRDRTEVRQVDIAELLWESIQEPAAEVAPAL